MVTVVILVSTVHNQWSKSNHSGLLYSYDSPMRDNSEVGTGITVSGIGTGDYFTVFNSSIEPTVTIDSERSDTFDWNYYRIH